MRQNLKVWLFRSRASTLTLTLTPSLTLTLTPTLTQALTDWRVLAEQLTCERFIEMFESYNSGEGLFYFLGGVLLKTEDTYVHFMYIEAKVGSLQDVERVTREDEHFPKRVADFLKEVRLPDQRPLINVCDRFDLVDRPHALPLLKLRVQVH